MAILMYLGVCGNNLLWRVFHSIGYTLSTYILTSKLIDNFSNISFLLVILLIMLIRNYNDERKQKLLFLA